MRKEILFASALIFLFGILYFVSAAPQNVFMIRLAYENGSVNLDNILVTEGYYNTPKDNSGEYEIKGVSCNGTILFSQKFDFDLEIHLAPLPEWFDEEGNQIYFPSSNESVIVLNSSSKEFIFPYYHDTREIVVTKNDVEVLSIEKGFDSSCEVDSNKENNMALFYVLGSLALIILFGVIAYKLVLSIRKR